MSDKGRIATRRIKCPKCRQPPAEYIEHVHVSTTFDAGPEWRSDEGHHSMGGDAFAVDAVCSCGHRWRLRGIVQITNLDIEVP